MVKIKRKPRAQNDTKSNNPKNENANDDKTIENTQITNNDEKPDQNSNLPSENTNNENQKNTTYTNENKLDELIENELSNFEVVDYIPIKDTEETPDETTIEKVDKSDEINKLKMDNGVDKEYVKKIEIKKRALEKIAPKTTDDCLIKALLDYVFYVYFLILTILFIKVKEINFTEKSEIVSEFIESVKPQLDDIKLQIEKFLSIHMPKQYEKLTKLNDVSFIIGLMTITLSFYGVCSDINNEYGYGKKKSKKQNKQTNTTKNKPSEIPSENNVQSRPVANNNSVQKQDNNDVSELLDIFV